MNKITWIASPTPDHEQVLVTLTINGILVLKALIRSDQWELLRRTIIVPYSSTHWVNVIEEHLDGEIKLERRDK